MTHPRSSSHATDEPTSPGGSSTAAPGQGDAVRATVGVIAAYGAAVLVAGLVALLTDPAAGEIRSAGSTRAQLAVQGLAFAALAFLLIEGLRLGQRPRSLDPFPNAAGTERPPISLAKVVTIVIVGAAACAVAELAGPLVSWLLPGLHDPNPPADGLGIGSGTAADLGTVLVIAGIVPLGEELLFRGALAGAWIRARRPGIAVLSSTILFGLAHVTVGSRSMVVDALVGAILALALISSGSLGACVLAHCSINAIALLDAGLTGTAPIVLLVAVVLVTTLAGVRLSPLVSWPATGDTLPE